MLKGSFARCESVIFGSNHVTVETYGTILVNSIYSTLHCKKWSHLFLWFI